VPLQVPLPRPGPYRRTINALLNISFYPPPLLTVLRWALLPVFGVKVLPFVVDLLSGYSAQVFVLAPLKAHVHTSARLRAPNSGTKSEQGLNNILPTTYQHMSCRPWIVTTRDRGTNNDDFPVH
jgi:hypothetical protein